MRSLLAVVALLSLAACATPAASARPSNTDELHARLSPLAFEVTQNAATEPPFSNEYWNNHSAGIYVDVVSGDALFSSKDKFESGTGWPSFTRPIDASAVVEKEDSTLGMDRTEVLSKKAGSHLGHVFDDGPEPTHRRYCMNSAALRFVPADRLVAEGYGKYAKDFGAGASNAPLPVATKNACVLPPPGEKPGCHTTLAVALFAALPDDARVARPKGVLDVERGRAGEQAAVEVTFDPQKISYADVVHAWTMGRQTHTLASDLRFERN